MSSVRGGGFGGRGRGSAPQTPQRGRGSASTRERRFDGNVREGNMTTRGSFDHALRQNGGHAPRGARGTRGHASSRQTTQSGAFGGAKTRGTWQERYQALTKARERERADAIRQGLIADPDKPRSLSEAITPTGTCQDMCAEYERVERVVQKDVWREETDSHQSAFGSTDKEPDESRMVKKFRRAAAGLEEQLPSDLRPPHILKHTCDYLFDDVIGNATSLGQVHHFVWDRTRAIRNDFSIQQLSKPEELRIAIDCYERIARFHILSLHQLALPEKPYSKYDWQQEREQLDRTLLSLMQYYDDSRSRVDLRNEAEFRAYCIIFQLQDPTPDLEDRVQTWPRSIIRDARVRKALELYMAACNVTDSQGPLKLRANHLTARQDWQRFWTLIASKEVSYLMACVAEIYFNLVRRTVMNALFRTTRALRSRGTSEWTVSVLCDLLAFDDEEDVYTYCERFGFVFKDREDGQYYLDLTSVKGGTLPEPEVGMPKQSRTDLVEGKRFSRTFPAIINGLTVKMAVEAGQTMEGDQDEDMESISKHGNQKMTMVNDLKDPSTVATDDNDSLFIPESSKPKCSEAHTAPSFPGSVGLPSNGPSTLFTTPSNGSKFGQPSTFGKPSSVLDQAAGSASSSGGQPSSVGENTPTFNFMKTGTATTQSSSKAPNTTNSTPSFNFNPTRDKQPSLFSGVSNWQQGMSAPEKSSISEHPQDFSKSTEDTTATTPRKDPSAPSSSWQTLSSFNVAPKPEHPQSLTFAPTVESKPSVTEQSNPSITSGLPKTETPAVGFFNQQPEQARTMHQHPAPSTGTTSNGNQTSSALNSESKRQSFSRDTRPKKPSPLQNFVNADEESIKTVASASLDSVFAIGDLVSEGRNQGLNTPLAELKAIEPEEVREDFESTLSRLTNELVNDQIAGYMKQYMEHAVGKAISEVQSELTDERLKMEADSHRLDSLKGKYGRKWRGDFWKRRLAKSGRERRERRQRRLLERNSEDEGAYDHESLRESNTARSSSGVGNEAVGNRQEELGNMSRHARDSEGSAAATSEEQVKANGKRRASSHHASPSAIFGTNRHKRLKSTSYVEEPGRDAKYTARSPIAEVLQRSSFLGFSLSPDANNKKSTTTSNYFRYKALGVNRADEASGLRGTKRPRSESLLESSQISPRMAKSPLVDDSTSGQSPHKVRMPQPAQSAPEKSDEEQLFARLKAARESLKESELFFKEEVAKEAGLRRSTGSQPSNLSPSMAKARADAKLRASKTDLPDGAGREVPAYRLRESRFVARDEYSKAIDRAKEIRESRSRSTSRPQSRRDDHDTLKQTPTKIVPTSLLTHATPHFGVDESTSQDQRPNGFTFSSYMQTQPPTIASSSKTSSFAPHSVIDVATYTPQLPSSNPFLRSPGVTSFDSFAQTSSNFISGQAALAAEPQDHTILPSNIDQALSNTFSNSHSLAQPQFEAVQNGQPTPVLQNSYQHSQTASKAVCLLSDDDEKVPQEIFGYRFDPTNGEETDEKTDEWLGQRTGRNTSDQAYEHANKLAVLANQSDTDEDEQDLDSEEDTGEAYDESAHDGGSDDDDNAANGYADDEDDGEPIYGNVDEGEEPDEDENSYDYLDEDEAEEEEEEEEDDDASHARQWQPQQQMGYSWASQPPQQSTLQGVGGTAEEAIELSD